MSKQNWFNTLNEALNSENLIDAWDPAFTPINYSQTKIWTHADGTRYGHYISIYRNEKGLYERPIHYSRN